MACRSWLLVAGVALGGLLPPATGVARAQESLDPPPVPAGQAATPGQFVGVWEYSSVDSVNRATGRPERGPRGTAPPRAPVTRPAPAARGGDGDAPQSSPFALSPQMMRENRDLTRDMLEIAETLTFAVSDESVTITDDLGRSWTYPTDNRRERYRIAASEFFARVRWEEGRLLREIEGRFGFRMTETYFLSPNANRLFVIIRIGDQARGRLQAAVDRVYDRVDFEAQ